MKNAKDPRIEEVLLPREMEKWTSSLAKLTGVLVPGQDVVNHFTIELARRRNEIPAYTHFVAGVLREDLWMPSDPPFVRAHENWKQLQTSHKRPRTIRSRFRSSSSIISDSR